MSDSRGLKLTFMHRQKLERISIYIRSPSFSAKNFWQKLNLHTRADRQRSRQLPEQDLAK